MRSVIPALLLAAALAPLAAGAADDNPLKRCKNHYILHQLGCADVPDGWAQAAPLHTYHGDHTATLLADGRVLVAGDTGVPEMTAEIYDAAMDTWTLTAPMIRDRTRHTATRMADGRVLVVGGEIPRNTLDWFPFEGTAEVFDPETNKWSETGSLVTKRGGFTATLLPTGEVLLVGGYDDRDSSLASAELYDPVAGRWRAAAPMRVARFWHTATSLPDGNVLVVGGWYDDWLQMQVRETEIYDWRSGTWSWGGDVTGRGAHSATLLDDGRVLVAGGYTRGYKADGWSLFDTLGTADIYDPATGEWQAAGNIGTPRYGHLAAPLRGGGALIVEGTESFGEPPSVTYGYVADAVAFQSQAWKDLGIPTVDPAATSVTRLDDGSLLFVGENRAVLYRY
jgi:hypothetical protein